MMLGRDAGRAIDQRKKCEVRHASVCEEATGRSSPAQPDQKAGLGWLELLVFSVWWSASEEGQTCGEVVVMSRSTLSAVKKVSWEQSKHGGPGECHLQNGVPWLDGGGPY